MDLVTKSFASQCVAFPGRVEKLLAEIDTVSGAKDLLDKAATMQHYAERLKAGIEIERPIALGVLKIKAKLGELMPAKPLSKRGQGRAGNKSSKAALPDFSKPTISAYRKLANNRDRLEEYYESSEDVPSQADFIKYINDSTREVKRKDIKRNLNSVSAIEAKQIEGVYDVVVIDPPWPMKKIERDVRPNQSEFDYPVMSEDELSELEVPCAEDCHVWLWTTHKFLPMAFQLLESWCLKYVCTFVWHKPGGFQPVGLPQYNCEFALYARKGTPEFLDTKAFPVCFDARRMKHSEKPKVFYDMVRRVTAGRRLDMFNRCDEVNS